MADPLFIPLTPAAMIAAMACVVAGGPWFADGLHTLRRRRALAALRDSADSTVREGPVTARGYVVLTSPLFGPLSGRPCAGYVLEVCSALTTVVCSVSDRREFQLATREGLADVDASDGMWNMSVGAERTVNSVSELTENLKVLLASTPELRWQVACGGTLVLRERALIAGAGAVVMGVARRLKAHALAEAEAPRLAGTGTDDRAWAVGASVPAAATAAPAWSIGPAELFERCIVSDGTPEAQRLAPPAWRLLGLLAGPALSLAGLLVLAEAAGRVLEGGL